ncbi:restriction endonuclease subunit S [Companilactobacillus farciminis]|uniref:restriction endonuclease subunit S n=1 Tax=Companilactobacillus farciminis TaxID=1612 RepID=UPI00232F5641|nr:restriction endonuclease subunit S [Companilactobacillus farciminis]WCG36829.1 restriction endonuclease subunit S [Companilactobacillus farciminis]
MWELRKLGDMAQIVRGASPRPIKSTKWFNDKSNIGWLRISDVTSQNGKITHLNQRLSEAGQNKTRIINSPHLLLSIAASVGKPVINYIPTGVHDGFLIFLKPKFEIEYMFQWLTYYQNSWKKYGQPGSQVNLNSDIVKSQNIFITTIPEQKKIESILKQMDNLITLQQRQLDLYIKLKKGLLQKLFPKDGEKVPEVRFANFTGNWKQRKLSELKDLNDKYSFTGGPFGSDLKSSDYTPGGVRIIQLQNIGDGSFLNNYKIYTSKEKAQALSSNLIYPGEIIIAKMADPLARATIIPKVANVFLMSSDGIRLKVDTKKYDTYFVLTSINNNSFRKKALENSSGTTRKRIGLTVLGNLVLNIPKLEEQIKIGRVFRKLDEIIILKQDKIEELENLKKYLLQKLFI